MTEAEIRQKVVATAESCVGFKESDGSHKGIIDVYNGHKPLARGYAVKYTDAWCATFGSAVAIAVELADIIPTECGCEEQIKLFQKMGKWVEDDAYVPQPGDYIFWDWQDTGAGDNMGYADHVGIVTCCDGKTITVVEGNKNNAVGYRKVAVNGKYIRGYGIPDYASKADKPKEPWYMKTKSWDKATAMGLIDGTRPEDSITRAEVAEVAVRLVERFEV